MLKKLYILAFLILVFSCQRENSLTLYLSEDVKSFVPNYSSDKTFTSENDTIVIRQISSTNNFTTTNSESGNSYGTLGEFESIQLEFTKLVIGSDTPYLRFHFELEAVYSPTSPRASIDLFSLSIQEDSLEKNTHLKFEYTDTLICISPNFTFSDSLSLNTKVFLNCYSGDSTFLNTLYLNETNGLVGFRTSSNELFELLD